MAHDVFISYSSEDKSAADAICHVLETRGIRCWIAPRDIPSGSIWREQIIEALDDSKALVLVFSSNANKSKQVERELSIAVDSEIPILPLRIEKVLPSRGFRYSLAGIHWLDALTPPLETHLERLADKIAVLLAREAEPARRAIRPLRTWRQRVGTLFKISSGIVVVVIALIVALTQLGDHLQSAPSEGLKSNVTEETVLPEGPIRIDFEEQMRAEGVVQDVNPDESLDHYVDNDFVDNDLEEAAVESAIRGHYGAIERGDFEAAYTYFSTGARRDKEGWISNSKANRVTDSSINSLEVSEVSGDTATAEVDVSFKDKSGTSRFWGIWGLVKENGSWKLDSPGLEKVD